MISPNDGAIRPHPVHAHTGVFHEVAKLLLSAAAGILALLALRDVLDNQKDHLPDIAPLRGEAARIEQYRSKSYRRELMLELGVGLIVGVGFFQELLQPGNLPVPAPDFVERGPLGLFARDLEPRIESLIGCLHAAFIIQNHQRIDHRVDDRFRIFAFVNRLFQTRPESGDVLEREHGASGPLFASHVRCYSEHEPRSVSRIPHFELG